MEQKLVWLTYENLPPEVVNDLMGHVIPGVNTFPGSDTGVVCTGFKINGVRVDGTPVKIELDPGKEFDSETGEPLRAMVRVGFVPVA